MTRPARPRPPAPRCPRRVLLFVPATEPRRIVKAAGLGADGVILDLEDGVALARKAEGRAGAVTALEVIDFGARERLVRINPVDGDVGEADLRAVLGVRRPPDAIVLPKVESAAQLRRAARLLDRLERRPGRRGGRTRLLAIIETARGVIRLQEITGATDRLEALIFGAEDLVGDLGGIRTAAGQEVLVARSAVALHAAAARLQAIDTPCVDLSDEAGLVADARAALALGYAGKLAIHPSQVEPIRDVFTPTAEAIAAARRLVREHDRRQAAGQGVFTLDGKMVDMPMVRAARAILARARAAGLPDSG